MPNCRSPHFSKKTQGPPPLFFAYKLFKMPVFSLETVTWKIWGLKRFKVVFESRLVCDKLFLWEGKLFCVYFHVFLLATLIILPMNGFFFCNLQPCATIKFTETKPPLHKTVIYISYRSVTYKKNNHLSVGFLQHSKNKQYCIYFIIFVFVKKVWCKYFHFLILFMSCKFVFVFVLHVRKIYVCCFILTMLPLKQTSSFFI